MKRNLVLFKGGICRPFINPPRLACGGVMAWNPCGNIDGMRVCSV
jgi:hypothetical protein